MDRGLNAGAPGVRQVEGAAHERGLCGCRLTNDSRGAGSQLLLRQVAKTSNENLDHAFLEACPGQVSQRLARHRKDLCLRTHRELVTEFRALVRQGLGQLGAQQL